MPAQARSTAAAWQLQQAAGSFLPTAGTGRRLSLPTELDPRMNLQTGTIALPHGVPDGLTYTVDSAVVADVTEQQLLDATITPVARSEELELLPPTVRRLAAAAARSWSCCRPPCCAWLPT